MARKKILLALLAGMIVLSACQMPARLTQAPPPLSTVYAELLSTLMPMPEGALTHGGPSETITEPALSTPDPSSGETDVTIWLDPGLSPKVLTQLGVETDKLVNDPALADLRIELGPVNSVTEATAPFWVYAAAAPYYTVTDEISMADLTAFWQGANHPTFEEIWVTAPTRSAMSTLFGAPGEMVVTVDTPENLDDLAISDDRILVILPFEDLKPIWKVLRVEGSAPIDPNFDPITYPLSLQIRQNGGEDQEILLPVSNYDPELRTVLVMTGVTALTRATAYQMAVRGNTFPGQNIRDWLLSADLTHISNEVPFAENCPAPDPNQPDLVFCSAPERMELLEDVGTDIIELTGNHMLDYGVGAMNLTLQMYETQGWQTYAGGWDVSDARTPALIQHNGNNLAFIGCNPVGPYSAFATETQPGAAGCDDYTWLEQAIQDARKEGYLPIVTLQYAEDYSAYPSEKMIADFKRLADAGAIVVNGSQAHTPKLMTFYQGSFLHYGLGNLFFDQMEVYYGETYMPHTRDEFIDRLVFYDNALVSVELLTAELEDYARPRPMTAVEREAFLSRIFSVAQDFIEE